MPPAAPIFARPKSRIFSWPRALTILRLVHHPHAAGAELAEDLVVRDGAADLELHRRWFLFGDTGGNYTPGGDPRANGAGTASSVTRWRDGGIGCSGGRGCLNLSDHDRLGPE